MATAAERVRDRLRPNGTVRTGRYRNYPWCLSLHEDLVELLADYRNMCELAGQLGLMLCQKEKPDVATNLATLPGELAVRADLATGQSTQGGAT